MIVDITNEIITELRSALTPVPVFATYPSTQTQFPCVVVDEISNISLEDTIDSNGQNHCEVSLQVDIFTNGDSQISDAKTVRGKIDTLLSGTHRMVRNFSGTTPNFSDASIYRYTLRYTFVVDSNRKIYRR